MSGQTCMEVKTHSKISDTRGYFSGSLSNDDRFGVPASLGDLNGDGIGDIAIGARRDDDGGINRGAIYIIFLDIYGRVKSFQKISDTQGGFTGVLDNGDEFGSAIESIGDINNDGRLEIMVGTQYDDDGGADRGAFWILSLNQDGTVHSHRKISDTQGGFNGILDNDDRFGNYLGVIGDLNGDNVTDVVVGSYNDDDGGTDRGAVYVLFLDTSGQVINEQKISDTAGNFTGILDNSDKFGRPTGIGDLNNDGYEDIAVGAMNDDDGGTNKGAVWILFLDSVGKVQSHQKISDTAGNFTGTLNTSDGIGNSIRAIGDLNGDLVQDIMVSSTLDNDGGTDRGAIWIMYLQTNGKVGGHVKISDTTGNFNGILDNDDRFGSRLAYLGDFNNDGMIEIAACATHDDDGGTDRGAVWILSLDRCSSGCGSGIQRRFEKVYKLSGNNYPHSITKSIDGSFAFSGNTNTHGAGGTDLFVSKVSSEGDTIWSRTYGSTSNDLGQSSKIKALSDSGYLVSGRSYGFGTSNGGAYILKLDGDGNVVWSLVVDSIANENARDLELTSDGGFIVSGTNGYILKFNSSGSMEWNRYFSGGGNMHMTSVIEIEEKREYLITGQSTGYGTGGRSGYFIYLDSNGTKLWERYYDRAYQQSFLSAARTDDKGFIIGGYDQITNGNNRLFTMKIDSAGKYIWSRKYDHNSQSGRVIHILKDKNEGFVVTGFLNYSGGMYNMIMKIDDYGNPMWSKMHKGNSNSITESYWGESLLQTDDGGYMFVNYGTNLNGPSNTGADPYIIKLNNCGEGACNGNDISFATKESELSTSDPTSSVQSWGTPTLVTTEVDTIVFTEETICEFDPSCQLVALFTSDTVCAGDTTNFTDLSYDSLANVTGWKWYFGDGNTNFTDQHPTHVYGSPGTYTTRLVVFNDDTTYCSDTIDLFVSVLSVPSPNLGPDTSHCYGDIITLNPGSGFYITTWSDSSSFSTLNVDTSGKYWVNQANIACSATDTILLQFDLPPIFSIGPDSTICEGDSFLLSANISNSSYLWSDSSTSGSIYVSTQGIHWLRVDSGSCTSYDSIQLTVLSFPTFDLGSDTTICEGDSIYLLGSTSNYNHLWYGGSVDTILKVDSNDVYWLSASNGPCVSSDTIQVNMDFRPVFSLGNDSILCQGDTLRLSTGLTSPNSFSWNTGSTMSNILVDSSDNYHVTVTNGVCLEFDSIEVLFDDSLTLDLGPDTVLCEGILYQLDASSQGATYIWNDSSNLPIKVVSISGEYWVVVSSANGGCWAYDTISIIYDTLPRIDLGVDTFLCSGDSIRLNALWSNSSYQWHNGETSSSINTNTSGLKWVQVTNGKCLTSDSVWIGIVEYPFVDLDSIYELCYGDTLELLIDSTFNQYLWSNADSSFYTTYRDSGINWVQTSNYKCSVTDTFFLTLLELPESSLKSNYEICDIGYVDVDAGNSGASFLWSDGFKNKVNRISDTGKVYVEITLQNGCSLLDSTIVSYCEFEVSIPNTITPNGDGSNDFWVLDGIEFYPDNTVQIFNRNGQLLYESHGYKNDWNGTWEGKELPATVYFFVVDLGPGKDKLTGTLTIIRE